MTPGEMAVWAAEFVAARRHAMSTPPESTYSGANAQEARDRWLADVTIGAVDCAWGAVTALREGGKDIDEAFAGVGGDDGPVAFYNSVVKDGRTS